MILLQLGGGNPLGGLIVMLLVSVSVVAFGTYVGVLMALQSFFEESSWQDVTGTETE